MKPTTWAAPLAKAIFRAQAEGDEATRRDSFHDLDPKLAAAYEKLAVQTVENAKKLPLADQCCCKKLVCTYDPDFGCGFNDSASSARELDMDDRGFDRMFLLSGLLVIALALLGGVWLGTQAQSLATELPHVSSQPIPVF